MKKDRQAAIERLREATRIQVDDEGSQVAFAKKIGISQSYLSLFLAGRMNGGMEMFTALAPVLPDEVQAVLGTGTELAPPNPLPELENLIKMTKGNLTPNEREYLEMLRLTWSVDRPLGQWADMLADYRKFHSESQVDFDRNEPINTTKSAS